MAQNIGTLITAKIKANDSLDLIATFDSNDGMGGHHGYATLVERNAIIEARREWGMLCTVYNDGANNGTYQLTYNASSTSITDNNNWKLFSGSIQSSSGGGEWLPSVLTIVDTDPVSPNNGERYLVATQSFSEFATHPTQIAEWDELLNSGSGGWVYTTPTNGSTLRVDDQKNVLYKFQGTYSQGGLWYKEYVTQIRYIQPTSVDGFTYSFVSSTDMVPLDAYSYSIYLANFGYTSSGASTLQIDGLGYFPMKKISANSKLDISSEDLIPGIQYHISWNDGIFQVHGFGGGASAGVIGPPEDTTYNDGLFQDFTESTPIGVPIDRFNEILLALVPPPAPNLSSWSLGGPSFVDGRLSFDGGTLGFTAAPGFGIGSLFNSSGFRKGINSLVNQPKTTSTYYSDITGILNSTVATGPGDPTPAYAANSFGNAITGSLVLKLNGSTVSNVDLSSTYSAINTTAGSNGGLNISAATSSKFPSGVAFEFFWNRTGTYVIRKDSTLLRSGFNYLDLTHILPSSNLILASYSWVSDNFTSSTIFSGPNINSITINSTDGVKTLSGIKFFNVVTFKYSVTYENHVSNTYSPLTSALSTSSVISGITNSITNTLTETTTPIFSPNPGSLPIPTPTSPSTSTTIAWTYSVNPNVRRMNETVSFSTTVVRTVQGTDTSSLLSDSNWFIDTYSNTSTDTSEDFNDESRRLQNNGSFKYGQYDNLSSVTTTNWVSSASLYSEVNHRNGLQVVNGMLVYPTFNFHDPGNSLHNPNFNLGNDVRYNLCNTINSGLPVTSGGAATNYRTFTRRFRVDFSTNYALLNFNITYTGTTFVKATTILNNNTNCWIEVKLPGTSNAVTGWLDMTQPFKSGFSANGDGANQFGTTIPSSGANWTINFGQKGTAASSGYVLLRITAPASWSGNISNISLTPTS